MVSRRLRLFGGISDSSVVVYDRAGSQVCLIDVRTPEYVEYALTRRQEIVGDDPAVATPPDGFRAHDGASVLATPLPEPSKTRGEGHRQRIVRVITKAAHPPVCVE